MYKGKFASELSMNEVKEYYDELRQKYPCATEEQLADFNILKEKLIAFAYKILDGKTNGDVIKPMFPGMNAQWRELKETIIEMRDNDGTGTQQEVCKFLANYMDVLEKQISGSENPNKWIACSKRLPKVGEKVLVHIIDCPNIDYDVAWIKDTKHAVLGSRYWSGKFAYGLKSVSEWKPIESEE